MFNPTPDLLSHKNLKALFGIVAAPDAPAVTEATPMLDGDGWILKLYTLSKKI